MALCLESQTRTLRARNDVEKALEHTQKHLQIEPTADNFVFQAELLERLIAAAPNGQIDRKRSLRLAADRAWHDAEAEAQGSRANEIRKRRELLRRVITRAIAGEPRTRRRGLAECPTRSRAAGASKTAGRRLRVRGSEGVADGPRGILHRNLPLLRP